MLLQEERRDQGRRLEQLLGIPQRNHQALRNQFRNSFVGLAPELRREEISRQTCRGCLRGRRRPLRGAPPISALGLE